MTPSAAASMPMTGPSGIWQARLRTSLGILHCRTNRSLRYGPRSTWRSQGSRSFRRRDRRHQRLPEFRDQLERDHELMVRRDYLAAVTYLEKLLLRSA